MTPAEIAAVTKTLETALGYLEQKQTLVEPKVPRAHAILVGVLEETGYRSEWEAGTLSVDEHVELLHLVRMEGRRYFRELAARTLDEIDELESKALFGPAKDKVSGFFRGARKYVRELFVAGVLAFAGPAPMDAAELRALDAEVAEQHAYLRTFEKETVEANRPPDGTFVARAEKYGASVWGGAQEILRAGAKAERHYSSERRIHQAHDKPCEVCLEEMEKEWQPLGTLRKIGDSPCMMNCHCVFIYGWAESEAKSFAFDSKKYVPCRDARGRFASCNGAPQGTVHPKPSGADASSPKPGSGGGKKPKKKPRKKPTQKPKEPSPKKPAENPAAKPKPADEKPKPPKENPEKKPPAEKPKESEPKPVAGKPKEPAPEPKLTPKVESWTPRPEKDFKALGTGTEMEAWGAKNYGKWAEDLTPSEQRSLKLYAGEIFHEMNGQLRGTLKDSDLKFGLSRETVQKTIDNATSALGKAKTPDDLVGFRGVSDFKAMGFSSLDDFKPGTAFTEKGFSSVSLSQTKAASFAYKLGDKIAAPVVFKVNVPKGSTGGYLNAGEFSNYGDERELLFPPNAKYRVVGRGKPVKQLGEEVPVVILERTH